MQRIFRSIFLTFCSSLLASQTALAEPKAEKITAANAATHVQSGLDATGGTGDWALSNGTLCVIIAVLDNEGDFSISGTTGSPASMTRYAKLDLNVVISLDKNVARILISGYSRVAFSMIMLYLFLFSIILLVGLLPGFIETDAENSGAMEALFFLILGIFVMVDVNKKLADPKEDLESALEAADTIFG